MSERGNLFTSPLAKSTSKQALPAIPPRRFREELGAGQTSSVVKRFEETPTAARGPSAPPPGARSPPTPKRARSITPVARPAPRARGHLTPPEALRGPRPRGAALASIEDVDYRTHRGLDHALFLSLRPDWIRTRRNFLITGPCGVGKSWLACALGHNACREDLSVLYYRVPRLFAALALARGDGRCNSCATRPGEPALSTTGAPSPCCPNRRAIS